MATDTAPLTDPTLPEDVTPAHVRALRGRQNWTQPAMAVALRVALRTIQSWENGERPIEGTAAVALWLLWREPQAAQTLAYLAPRKKVH